MQNTLSRPGVIKQHKLILSQKSQLGSFWSVLITLSRPILKSGYGHDHGHEKP